MIRIIIFKIILTSSLTRSCKIGWTHYNDQCFIYFNKSLIQMEAFNACVKLNASLINLHDQNSINFMVNLSNFSNFWVIILIIPIFSFVEYWDFID